MNREIIYTTEQVDSILARAAELQKLHDIRSEAAAFEEALSHHDLVAIAAEVEVPSTFVNQAAREYRRERTRPGVEPLRYTFLYIAVPIIKGLIFGIGLAALAGAYSPKHETPSYYQTEILADSSISVQKDRYYGDDLYEKDKIYFNN